MTVSKPLWARVVRASLVPFAVVCSPACGDEPAPTEVVRAPVEGDSVDGDVNAATPEPPPPTTSDAPCIIGADCPEGTYCDLGVCIQSCSTEAPCAGELVCSPRGRCIEPNAADRDPPPVPEHVGTLRADPIAAELSELDDRLEVRLVTDAAELVRYRVEVRAPFLTLEGGERGEFAGEGLLRFTVNPRAAQGTLSAGSIVIHSTLGNVVLRPTLRVGLTGRYQGILRYGTDPTPLGDVGIVVDMLDDNGDVVVRVDPDRSMTFPAVQDVAAAGRGIFTYSEGLSVTVAQVFDSAFGGARNHFQRPIGRRIAFSLNPTGGGKLEGTFAETLHGIVEQPIALTGTAYLEPVEGEPPATVDLSELPSMPTRAAGALPSIAGFGGDWSDTNCFDASCASSTLDCIRDLVEPVYYEPLKLALSAARTTADPFGPIAEDCVEELAIGSTEAYRAAPRRCALVPPLACSMNLVATGVWTTEQFPLAQATYNRLYARVLAPPLLVAQNHIVQALKASFDAGIAVEAERLGEARRVLSAPGRFALASGVLEYLQALPVAIAAGDNESEDVTESNYPAGRALARLIYVLHTIDAEEARADATELLGTREEKQRLAQERGVLAFLEAAALAGVLERWGNPPNLGTEFVGTLTLADRGFTGLQQGALIFGVPEGEVPLVYDPARPQPTNFEQVLELRARPALEQFISDEAAFETASREFEQSGALLQNELEAVRRTYEDQIAALCGESIDFDALVDDAAWDVCGADGSGEVAELNLAIEQTYLRLQAQQARIEGMGQKYRIDEQRLAASQRIRRAQIQFADQTGSALEGLAVQEGILNVAQRTIEIAANANVFNAGAPIAMAAASAVLEGMRTQVAVARQRLQTAHELRALEADLNIELQNGMAELKKLIVDTAQLELEMEQDALAIVQADLSRRNALDRAKRLSSERARALERISRSPLQDPLHRMLDNRLALQVVRSRAEAQRWLYRAGRALEYEMNSRLAGLPRAVLGAYNGAEAQRLSRCLLGIFADHTAIFGVPQEFTTTVSVREVLGFTESRTDEVTGEIIAPAELFRRSVLRNENIDRQGDLTVTFPTNLQPGNPLWSSNVCDDKIARVQAQLVGDFLGDNEAELHVVLEGGGVVRRCEADELINWDMRSPGIAVVQAGVNTFGDVTPNSSLAGQSVARASWRIIVPSGASAPANADLDLQQLDDIVLRITHEALARRNQSVPLDVSCLGTVGAGG